MKSIYTEQYRILIQLLVEKRNESGLTQQALSKRLGKPQSYVSKYENGERRLDVIEFLTIAKALKADPCDVIRKMEQSLPSTNNERKV